MRMVLSEELIPNVPWYRTVNKKQWNSLLASNLGWLFDGYETYALILTVGVALKQLLNHTQVTQVPFYAGLVIAITLLGWGIGGVVGGIVADYLGRKRTMMISILAYAVLTGLSAFAWSWMSFAILRFVVGLCIGSEWGTGTSMVAETFPDKARAKAAGFMQCGLGIGFFLASLVWYFMSSTGTNSWRFMFLIGIVPALAVLWIRRNVDESERWEEVRDTRKNVLQKQKNGQLLNADEQKYTRFTLTELFADKKLRRITILGLLMSLTTTVGWWGISTWIPNYVSSVAVTHHLSATHWASLSGMIYNVGAIGGYIMLGFMAEAWGRKKTTILYFGLSLILTPVLFLWVHSLALILVFTLINGVFTLGQYTWMPVWLPECFPTRTRATGISFVFNAARFVAFLGPLFAGTLIAKFGGYGIAATTVGSIYILGFVVAFFYPETKGQPLPE